MGTTLDSVFKEKAKWPPKEHQARLISADKFNALFDNDQALVLSWVRKLKRRVDTTFARDFTPFPAPQIAARTLASFLFGENASVVSEQAQDVLDEWIEENHLHSLNQEAALTAFIEGEGYYKLDWDTDVSTFSIVSFVAGSSAIPEFRFGRLVRVGFVKEFGDEDKTTVWRHVEIREKGTITHQLWKGSAQSLGVQGSLDDREEVRALLEGEDIDDEGVVDTGIDDLLTRHVPVWRTSRSPHGISVFHGKDGLIEGIHALYTQDQHDAEMSKKRVAASSEYLKRDKKGNPVFDRNLDILELSDSAAGAVGADSKPIHPIEFTDSTTMGERIAQRLDEFLLACGIAPQSAGRDVAGAAESGTARKLAQSLTLSTVATAGRYFTPALRDIVRLGLEVGAKHLSKSVPEGFDVVVTLADGMIRDEKEIAANISTLRTAQAISIEQAVREQHPDWDDQQVLKEVKRIEEEQGLSVPGVIGGGNLPNPEEVEDEDEEDDKP